MGTAPAVDEEEPTMEDKLIVRAVIYETDPLTDLPLLQNGKPIEKKVIGMFTFHRPTVRDELAIGAERSRLLEGRRRLQVEEETWMLAEVLSTMETLCDITPEGWDWFAKAEEIASVYHCYLAAIKAEFDGNKPQATTD